MQHTIDTKVWADRFPEAKVICPAIFKESLQSKKGVTVPATAEEFLPTIGVKVHVPEGVKPLSFDVGGGKEYVIFNY